MKLYRFSPIKNKSELLKAITYIHFACHRLCKQSFGNYLPIARNIGVFCHYDEEFLTLTNLRKEMSDAGDNWNNKYFRLHEPITVPAEKGILQTTYTYLYIRKPDPTHPQAGDLDFYLEPSKYAELKKTLLTGNELKGARILKRPDLDYVELYDPNIDAYGYVGTHRMTML